MTTIDTAITDRYGLDSSASNTINKELGQEEFLELMMAQLENQDPMEPMDNGEFLGQMAQFSTVSGIEEMQKSLDSLAATYASSQTLQSTQLVGQEVLVEDNTLELGKSGTTDASFEIDYASGDIQVSIADASGKIVRNISLGEHAPGRHTVTWNGLDNAGERVAEGQYAIQVSAKRNNEYYGATVMTPRTIESVEFGNGSQTTLNTQQGDVLRLEDIKQIRQALDNDNRSDD